MGADNNDYYKAVYIKGDFSDSVKEGKRKKQNYEKNINKTRIKKEFQMVIIL